MRARRYVYSNMSLDGHAFIYKATGGSILLSLVIIFIIYHIGTFLIVNWFYSWIDYISATVPFYTLYDGQERAVPGLDDLA